MQKRKSRAIAIVVLIVIAIVGYVYFRKQKAVDAVAVTPPVVQEAAPIPLTPPAPPSPPAEPAILNPIEAPPTAPELPALGQSDTSTLHGLTSVFDKNGLALLLVDDLVYHFVVTIDNLPRKHLPAAIVPLKRASGPFMVVDSGEGRSIDPKNSARYEAFVSIARKLNAKKLVAFYTDFYPLFQQAYVELGYPKAYFNDRLVVAIDDLLAAPQPPIPVELAQPKVLYQFTDPELEARSAGQKIMMRIGRDNALTIKSKLREIRRLVARIPLPAESSDGPGTAGTGGS